MKIKPLSCSKIYAVIPARYASTRFPGKPLALISGKTMIERVYIQAVKAGVFKDVIVATDDVRIASCVKGFGGRAIMTPASLSSGTDRVAFAMKKMGYDWVFNIQGDEPLVSPKLLRQLVKRIDYIKSPSIITAAHPIDKSESLNPNNVKVVTNKNKRALYFSRSPIPDLSRSDDVNSPVLYKHIGLYLFHKKALETFVNVKPSVLEKVEKLEQLRAFDAGIPIEVVFTKYKSVNVDSPEDITVVEKLIKGNRR